MADLAQAYVQIIPSAEGISGNIEKVMSPEADNAGKKSGTKFSSSFSDTLDKAGGKMSSAGKKLSAGVTAPITALGTAAIASWKSVDEAMDTVTTKTGASGKALTDMQNRAKAIATTIPVSFQEAGDAIGEVNTRFGLTGDSLQTLSQQFVEFASLNKTDVSTSVDSVQKAMAAFGLQTQDTGKMLDVLNKAGQDTGVNVVTLADDLSTNAGALKQMGYSASDAAMLLANLSKNGVDSTSAMMGLNKVYAKSVETGKPMSDILSDLTKKLQDNKTYTEAAQEASDLFGTRASSKLIPALKDGRLSFDQLGTSLSDYAGNVTDTYNKTLDPLDQMTVNMNKLKEAGAELVEAAAPMITKAMGTMSDVITRLTTAWDSLDDGQQETIIKIAGIAAAAGPVIGIGGKAVSTIGTVAGAGQKLIGGIGSLVGKLGGVASGAGSAVESVSSVGSAASNAAAPVASAGSSMGTLSQNALGLVAAGAGILLASAGIALLAQSAIQLSNAGTPAALAMVGLTAAVAGMAVGAALLAPALTAGAVGLVAFGAGVALVGVGVLAATSGIALLASKLPTISLYGSSAAAALGQVSVAILAASGSAIALTASFAAMLLPMAGAAGTIALADVALIGLAGTFTLSAGGAALLGASMLLVANNVKSIAMNASVAGATLKTMVSAVSIVNTAVDTMKSKMEQAGHSIASLFTKATPSTTSSARSLVNSVTNTVTSGTSSGLTKVGNQITNGVNKIGTNTTRQMKSVRSGIKGSLNEISRDFATTKLSFNRNIQLPHFSMKGSFDAKTGRVPTVGVNWYRKAYDNAYLLNGATIFGAMNGHLLGGGDGSGSEVVVGTDKLIDVIREAVGSTGYTQNLTINSPRELSPSEVARQTRNANRQMVLALRGYA